MPIWDSYDDTVLTQCIAPFIYTSTGEAYDIFTVTLQHICIYIRMIINEAGLIRNIKN